MKKTKWGIIGTGKIANTFATALSGCENSELCAVASRTKEKAQAFADKFGFRKAYGSYKELAEDSEVDIVYIATPMSSHYGDAMLCLENGRNVLCEKTLTLNADDCEKLLGYAESKKLFFMEAIWMKTRPTYLKVLEWIKSGMIGKVEYIKADFCNFIPYDGSDRLFKAESGGGALLDLGVYPLTMTADILGYSPKELISDAHIGRDKIDLSNTMLLRYDGAFASLSSGFEVQNRNNAVIAGDKGSIVMGDWFFCSEEAVLYDLDTNEIERCHFPNEINGYEYEIRECERCLAEGLTQSPLIPHESTLSVMKLMDECRRQWGMRFPGE